MDVEFSSIRDTPQIKGVFEALLIDDATPGEVYMELFGVSMEQVKAYKEKYEGPWDRPRMFCYDYISSNLKDKAQILAFKVFNGGWSVMDALFNGGKNINTADMAMKVLRIIAGRSGIEAVENGKFSPKLIAAAKNMVATSYQYSQIDGANVDESWDFMIKELADKERAAKLPASVVAAYNQVTKELAERSHNEEEKNVEDLV